MGKIRDLPICERPREKALTYGIESLSDIELIAIILGSGYQGQNVNELAARLVLSNGGIKGLSSLSFKELCSYKGVKSNKALLLLSIFELEKRLRTKSLFNDDETIDSLYLFNKYRALLKDCHQEILIIVIINRKQQIIFEHNLYRGNDRELPFSLKDILRILLNHNGSGYYLLHNHPSGDITPSKNDMYFTSELIKESKKIKIPLIDHLIIGESGYSSIANILKT